MGHEEIEVSPSHGSKRRVPGCLPLGVGPHGCGPRAYMEVLAASHRETPRDPTRTNATREEQLAKEITTGKKQKS